jgi:hypothetical protein
VDPRNTRALGRDCERVGGGPESRRHALGVIVYDEQLRIGTGRDRRRGASPVGLGLSSIALSRLNATNDDASEGRPAMPVCAVDPTAWLDKPEFLGRCDLPSSSWTCRSATGQRTIGRLGAARARRHRTSSADDGVCRPCRPGSPVMGRLAARARAFRWRRHAGASITTPGWRDVDVSAHDSSLGMSVNRPRAASGLARAIHILRSSIRQ